MLLQQFYEIFSKTYFISILDSHVILWNSKQISMRFHKEFGTIVQLFEFNPLSKCANKAVYQICLFWNWTEWEQCTNSKSPVEWYAIFYSNTCLTCFFWIEKKGILIEILIEWVFTFYFNELASSQSIRLRILNTNFKR